MSHNLFICVELLEGCDDSRLLEVVSEFESQCRLTLTTWYVSSALGAAEVATHVWGAVQALNKLLVIDATQNVAATFNVPDELLQVMRDRWHASSETIKLSA